LRMIATQCTQHVRQCDVAIRWGGDEFLIVAPETTRAEAQEMAERLRASMGSTVPAGTKTPTRVSVSLGVASLGSAATDEDAMRALLLTADAALRQAKRAGRDCVSIGS
jgi:diguanylate cyclase (GGDEF)-like protein